MPPRPNILATLLLLVITSVHDAVLVEGGSGKEPVPYLGYAALCAVARNENRYVREWVDYHKCLGFSRIYLYDHDSTEHMDAQLSDHISSGFLNYTLFSGHHRRYSRSARPTTLDLFLLTAQGYAYRKCVKHHGRQHSFLGFIDLDEFLVFTDPNITNVEQLLRPYEPYAGLAVHWLLAGSSNHTQRPEGPVLSSYTHCMRSNATDHRQFKSFLNTAARPVMANPHRPHLLAPDRVAQPHLVDENSRRIRDGSKWNRPTHNRAAVMHFVVKSWQDYEEKLARGGGAGVQRKADFFHYVSKKARHPCAANPAALQARLCPAGSPSSPSAFFATTSTSTTTTTATNVSSTSTTSAAA